MYLIVNTCPVCGAPIFARTTAGEGQTAILDAANGLWASIPEMTFTCECRSGVSQRVAEVADQYRRMVRPGSFGTGKRE